MGCHPRVAGIEVTVLAKNNFKQQSATRRAVISIAMVLSVLIN